MASISNQIDHAAEAMKARAAQFDQTKSLGADDTARSLLLAARKNLTRVTYRPKPSSTREDIIDTMNLCALALAELDEVE